MPFVGDPVLLFAFFESGFERVDRNRSVSEEERLDRAAGRLEVVRTP